MAFTPDGIAPPGIPYSWLFTPPTTMRYRTVFGGVVVDLKRRYRNIPCRFGVKNCPDVVASCVSKRRLKGGVRGSLVAASAAARCQVLGSTPASSEIWIEFSAPCAPLFRLWDHNIGCQSQSQAWKLT